MPFNFPIFLTWLRIVLIPLVVGVFYLPDVMMSPDTSQSACNVIFVLAALTDWFDGYLARKLNQTSAFARVSRPPRGQAHVTAALLVLVQLMRLNAVIALVIVGRELTIFSIARWMAQIGASKSVAVNSLGKFKTGLPDGRHPDAAVLRAAEDCRHAARLSIPACGGSG